MQIGRVASGEIRTNRDGEGKVLLLTVEISEPDDLQTVELITQAGENYNPPEDSTVIVIELGEAWKAAIACDDGIEPTALEEGERELYSSDGGVKKAIATFKQNGDIELNINEYEDFAVRFSKLEEAFNDLQTAWNLFAGAYVPGGPAGIGTPPTASTSTKDIGEAKIDNIKVPGVTPS